MLFKIKLLINQFCEYNELSEAIKECHDDIIKKK